ncbi:MATE family efflux transporter [Herbaspirillum sp. RTI4]|uniref:MATE family efflux transporter n=1 Tax=Herbaspirillum sp. RTI4 TaxID=3048640 RepID=UPI002AB32ECF|nr:MATE family efflux transporter [Herbaspirillum sp. RTI4]MDY7580051.1 MATE family efflux transporter [Herbaspirillum sp. RTI4]MEA9982966.1 MATE family efflux transporter [Herbaspirillum sp. RTI4]
MTSRTPTTRIAALAWPILIGQLALIANGVIDTTMAARFSAIDLAALALGVSIYVSIFVGLSGVMQALLPTIGQLAGAQRFAAIGAEVKQGLWLALILSIVGGVVLLFSPAFLQLSHIGPELQAKTGLYLQIQVLALPATLLFRVYAALNTALLRPKMVMAIQIVALALKVPLNALFVFGGLGIPALGGPGCALASTLIAWLMALIAWALVYRFPFYRQLHLFGSGFVWPQWKTLSTLLKLGIPMGMSYFIEVTAFTLMAIFIARLGPLALGGHQIAANMGTVLYMLPLSIASATGTLVAQAIGAGNPVLARHIGNAGIRLAALLSVLVGLLVWLGREAIIRAYTPDAAIIAAALPLFVYIGFYQLFDSVQVTAAFILRAYKVALVPTLIYALALWGIGLGGGYLLGLDPYHLSPPMWQGAAGFWLGNSASLGLVAISLLYYLRRVQRRTV